MTPLLKSRGFRDEDVSRICLLLAPMIHVLLQIPPLLAALKEEVATNEEVVFDYIKRILSFPSLSCVDALILEGISPPIITHLGSLLLHGNLKSISLVEPFSSRGPRVLVSDDMAIALVGYISQQTKLRALKIGVQGYSNIGVAHIVSLIGKESTLSELDITCGDEESLVTLARGLRHNVSVVTLSLSITSSVSNDTILEFKSALEVNQSLLNLALDGKLLTEMQWKEIFTALQLTNIRSLNVSMSEEPDYNPVALAEYLRVNTTLKHLTLNVGNNVATSAIAQAISDNRSHGLEDIQGSLRLRIPVARAVLGLDSYFGSKSNRIILKYLKEMKGSGATTVKRTKLIFVGNGEVGKSTLIRRMRDGQFEENSQIMTDGIDISYFKIRDIEMSVFDFAGQPEYEHTHSLFFDKSSIYLLLYSPRAGGMERLKIYQQMILNCVPKATVVFITTRADEARLSADEFDAIREACPNIVAYVPVDSKSGTGIQELEEILVDIAMKKETTVKTIPSSFERFRKSLQSFGSSRFNISYEEIRALCTSKLDIKGSFIDLALDLFLSWGYIFRLSNGDYVLQPQQLADVMACVFTKLETTKSRIGDVREGVLRHTNEVLDAVWSNKFPTLSKTMWRCSADEPNSPFISLLYQAGLAFELFDSQSKPIGASLVPGLLPLHPCGFQQTNPSNSYTDRLCELFVPASLSSRIHPRVTITFREALPTAFVGRLQVKLRRMATLGGAWKRGCCLVLQEVDTSRKTEISGPQNTDQVSISSMVILYQPRDEVFEIISAGEDTSARSTFLSIMTSLIQKQFPCVSVSSVKLNYKGREYGQDDLLENMQQGFINHRATNESIGIGGLRILFPDLPPLPPPPIVPSSSTPSDHRSLTFLDEANPFLPLLPNLDKLKELERLVMALEARGEDLGDDGDFVFVSDKLHLCIPILLQIMGLRFSRRRGLSTLWIVCAFQKAESATSSPHSVSSFVFSLPRLYAVPLSPTRVQGTRHLFPL